MLLSNNVTLILTRDLERDDIAVEVVEYHDTRDIEVVEAPSLIYLYPDCSQASRNARTCRYCYSFLTYMYFSNICVVLMIHQ